MFLGVIGCLVKILTKTLSPAHRAGNLMLGFQGGGRWCMNPSVDLTPVELLVMI
jgi:hypothetical protein